MWSTAVGFIRSFTGCLSRHQSITVVVWELEIGIMNFSIELSRARGVSSRTLR